MSDRTAVGVAVLAALSAYLAPPVPPAAALLFVALWAVTRRPALLAIALLVLVGGRASGSLAALERPVPDHLRGPAQLASDPEATRFDTRFTVRMQGRRYLAQVPNAAATEVRDLLTGEWIELEGRIRPLRSAPQGWVRSQHLAGRLVVSSVTDARRCPPWYRIANATHRLLSAGASPFGERRSLYLGLVIGDDRGQGDLTRFRFEAAGLTHLLAVSGSNVAFVLAVFAPITRRLGRRGRLVVGGVVLVVFALVTRAEPSVLRATVMAAVALGAVTLGRVAPGARILAVAVMLLLVADPLLVHSIGFQLSVAATAGLMTFARPLADRLPGPRGLVEPLAVTIAAQVATAPIVMALNGGIPAAATAANLLAGPAAGAVMMLGVTAGLVAGLVGDGTAAVVQLPAVVLVGWIDQVAAIASRLPLPVLGPGRLALAVAAAAAGVATPRGSTVAARRTRGAACVLCALAVLWPAAPSAGIDVVVPGAVLGVGRCGGRILVLDAAPGERTLLRSLWRTGVRRLDVVVVSGRRSDTAAALVVAEQFQVGRIVTVAEQAPPGIEALAGRELAVGGVRVAARPPSDGEPRAQIGVDDARCSVAR